MGGYDILKSQYSGSEWKTPENLGYPLNSSDDDKFFQPVDDGRNAYFSMTTDYKKQDIIYISLGYEITGTVILKDTSVVKDKKYAVHLINRITGDTLEVSRPHDITGIYEFLVSPGEYSLSYTGPRHISQKIDTTILANHKEPVIKIDVELNPDLIAERVEPPSTVYDKIDLSRIPVITAVDSSMMVLNYNVNDISDNNINDSEILYFTVQVIALYNPVDVSYFKRIDDLKVMYNEVDRFYRYTTGVFSTREEAYAWRTELIRRGYPDDIFIKKVSK
jgi:hypothetical protein